MSVTVAPALSAPDPAVIPVPVATTDETVGTEVSLVKVMGELAVPELPASSVTLAVSDLLPSGPSSALRTVKSTKPLVTFVVVSLTVFAGTNAAPSRSSSTVSPLAAPDVPRPTRIVIADAASVAFSQPSASVLEVSPAGALGATRSLVKVMGRLPVLGLPATSVTLAVIDFTPSAPRSGVETGKSTYPAVMSAETSVFVLGTANAAPPRSSSTVSPLAAPDGPMLTRIVVAVAASVALRKLSANLVEPCSAGVAGADRGTVSSVNARAVVGLLVP